MAVCGSTAPCEDRYRRRDKAGNERTDMRFYERITLAPALPQGITCSVPMKLAPDGYYENCSVQGKWEYTADHRGMIAYGPYTEEVRVYCGWDAQRKCETILLCGLRSDGVAFWAKRIGNLV